MLRVIRKFFFVFFFIFSFVSFSYSSNVVNLPIVSMTGIFQYTDDFISKAKYVSALIYSYYSYSSNNTNVYIPVLVKYKTYFDLLLFGIKSQNTYVWNGYCYNDPDQDLYISYYMYSNVSSVVGLSSDDAGGAVGMWCSDNNFPMIKYPNGQYVPVPGGLQANGRWFGPNNTRFNFSHTYPVYVSAEGSSIRDAFASAIADVSKQADKPIITSIDLDAPFDYVSSMNLSTSVVNVSSLNTAWQYPENTYLQTGYIEASDGDLISTTPSSGNSISTSSFLNSNSVSGSSVPVCNVDLSTTNKLLSGMFDFFRSTYVDQSDIDSFTNSVNQSTSIVHSIFSHFFDFFHTTSNDVWDCTFDFSSMTFLDRNFNLGKFNLCERWGWVFDLMKKLVKFSALVMAFYIVGGV